jgi:hypothetical protein
MDFVVCLLMAFGQLVLGPWKNALALIYKAGNGGCLHKSSYTRALSIVHSFSMTIYQEEEEE